MLIEQPILVTGATSGIGKGIVKYLSHAGYKIIAAGRNDRALLELSKPPNVTSSHLDLADLNSIQEFIKYVENTYSKLSAVVNCAGIYKKAKIESTTISDFDSLYKTNVRGPLALNKGLLPHIVKGGWCIVLNSSSSIHIDLADEMGPFVSTQASLAVLTKAIRNEYNCNGVRVLSIFPGRTATERMDKIFAMENRKYNPDSLLQPSDIGQLISYILSLPERVEITDIHMRPSEKSY